jgi:hypothetical protein
VRKRTPTAIRTISAMTTDDGRFEMGRLVAACERALKSPRALRDLLAA